MKKTHKWDCETDTAICNNNITDGKVLVTTWKKVNCKSCLKHKGKKVSHPEW